MLHMIRNAVDHGIESPEEREAQSKEPEAEIRLLAEYVGDSIRVVIEDDGRGIDLHDIRQKAASRGVMSAERAAARARPTLQRAFDALGFLPRPEILG
jgi:chemotaxis protein histidine kinase CheA